jgi:hypothetical protein
VGRPRWAGGAGRGRQSAARPGCPGRGGLIRRRGAAGFPVRPQGWPAQAGGNPGCAVARHGCRGRHRPRPCRAKRSRASTKGCWVLNRAWHSRQACGRARRGPGWAACRGREALGRARGSWASTATGPRRCPRGVAVLGQALAGDPTTAGQARAAQSRSSALWRREPSWVPAAWVSEARTAAPTRASVVPARPPRRGAAGRWPPPRSWALRPPRPVAISAARASTPSRSTGSDTGSPISPRSPLVNHTRLLTSPGSAATTSAVAGTTWRSSSTTATSPTASDFPARGSPSQPSWLRSCQL